LIVREPSRSLLSPDPRLTSSASSSAERTPSLFGSTARERHSLAHDATTRGSTRARVSPALVVEQSEGGTSAPGLRPLGGPPKFRHDPAPSERCNDCREGGCVDLAAQPRARRVPRPRRAEGNRGGATSSRRRGLARAGNAPNSAPLPLTPTRGTTAIGRRAAAQSRRRLAPTSEKPFLTDGVSLPIRRPNPASTPHHSALAYGSQLLGVSHAIQLVRARHRRAVCLRQ
jgi:hypothetical protein